MKFNDEELSRILSAHEAGDLDTGGMSTVKGRCCAVQAAKLGVLEGYWTDDLYALALRFDVSYSRAWSSVALLRWLESQGVA